MSLQDRKRVERKLNLMDSLAFCGSGGSSIPPRDEPDPHFPFRSDAVVRECRKLLVAGPSTLWRHCNKSYYVLTNHLTREAYLVIGSRAGELEADLRRFGRDPDQIETARTVQVSDDVGIHACLCRYFWMRQVEEQVLLSFQKRRG
jgi:hypothetical protein